MRQGSVDVTVSTGQKPSDVAADEVPIEFSISMLWTGAGESSISDLFWTKETRCNLFEIRGQRRDIKFKRNIVILEFQSSIVY